MIKMNRRSVLKATASTAALAAMPVTAFASYSASDLNGALTPLGGLRAGNADGSIPAWTGGYTTVSPDYVPGQPRPIPDFLNDAPLFSITNANLAQYQGKLTAGQLGMFQKYPDYRMDIYKTYRTASAPEYVYDYIAKNATSAQLTNDGNAVANAYGGIPFPIPTDGHQVMWNHLLAWAGTTFKNETFSHTVTDTGEVVLEAVDQAHVQYPYYLNGKEGGWNGIYLESLLDPIAPPYEAGGFILQRSPLNPYLIPVQSYAYLAGERRVRSAPELQYDTPNSLTGGTVNWDEFNIFSGKLDEYDYNYLGTKEIYVPYNCNKAWSTPTESQFQPHFLNPAILRWELHRVRVVELTLKPGRRNVDTRRLVYTDEDGGAALMGEVYDALNALWKFQHMVPSLMPDIPCHVAGSFFLTYDLHSSVYSCIAGSNANASPSYEIIAELPNTYFTAGELVTAASGF